MLCFIIKTQTLLVPQVKRQPKLMFHDKEQIQLVKLVFKDFGPAAEAATRANKGMSFACKLYTSPESDSHLSPIIYTHLQATVSAWVIRKPHTGNKQQPSARESSRGGERGSAKLCAAKSKHGLPLWP